MKRYIFAAVFISLIAGGALSVKAQRSEHARAEIARLVNLQRNRPLVLDANLSAIAQARANDMVARGYFDHVSPEGKRFWHDLKAQRYYYGTAAENLASGYSTDKQIVQGWMGSSGHRANIVNPRFTRTGIGIAGKGRRVVIVQLFVGP
jgi:uncharacterized protein YkwD